MTFGLVDRISGGDSVEFLKDVGVHVHGSEVEQHQPGFYFVVLVDVGEIERLIVCEHQRVQIIVS